MFLLKEQRPSIENIAHCMNGRFTALLLWPAHTCSEALASTTLGFVTLIIHFPIILSTPIGRKAPSPLSSGSKRLANIASILRGSLYFVHSRLVIVAVAVHISDPDFFKELHASILLKPLASTPEGLPDSSVLNAASRAISALIW